VAAAAGLLFWLVLGTVVVRWYDRKGLYRLSPDLLAYVTRSVDLYKSQQGTTDAPSSGPDGHETQ
jgi:hypothetical protein